MSDKEEPVDLVAMVYQLQEENRRLRQSLEWAIQKLEDYKKITLNPEAVKAVIDHGLDALGGK